MLLFGGELWMGSNHNGIIRIAVERVSSKRSQAGSSVQLIPKVISLAKPAPLFQALLAQY